MSKYQNLENTKKDFKTVNSRINKALQIILFASIPLTVGISILSTPIWTVFYTHGDKEYVFAMNGQTGKVVGKPPISFKKVAAVFLGGTTIATLLQYLLFGIILCYNGE